MQFSLLNIIRYNRSCYFVFDVMITSEKFCIAAGKQKIVNQQHSNVGNIGNLIHHESNGCSCSGPVT